jgi:sRNA-binding protein
VIAPSSWYLPVWRIKSAVGLCQNGGKGAYLHAFVKGGLRYALDGTPSGEVTAAEHEQAKRDLEAVFARHKATRQVRHDSGQSRRGMDENTRSLQAAGAEDIRVPSSPFEEPL